MRHGRRHVLGPWSLSRPEERVLVRALTVRSLRSAASEPPLHVAQERAVSVGLWRYLLVVLALHGLARRRRASAPDAPSRISLSLLERFLKLGKLLLLHVFWRAHLGLLRRRGLVVAQVGDG